MATTTTHCKMGIVDSLGNVNVLYPQTTGADVSITPNSVVSATSVQGLVDSLKGSAFLDNFTGIDDTSTTSTTATYSASKIAGLNSDNTLNIQTLTNKVANMQGVNLLDNPFFTVNSRRRSSYTSVWEYTFDRWKMALLDSVSISNDVVTIVRSTQASNFFFQQLLSNEYVDLLNGKTLTLSVMLSDNTILSVTGTYTKAGGWSVISKVDTNNHIWFHVSAGVSGLEECSVRIAPYPENNSVAIKAVKLELGSVSTLAQDTAPNYATELASCRSSKADPVDTFANRGDIAVTSQLSNPNLLDNPWFTVNQRGFTSGQSNGYNVDRWSSYATDTSNSTLALTNGMMNIVCGSTDARLFYQKIDDIIEQLVGKTVIISVMLSDGTIFSGTRIVPTEGSTDTIFIGSDNRFFVAIRNTSSQKWLIVTVNKNKEVTIKAVKLELGSVSTLAMDTAPNYATELLKCQMYFCRIGGTTSGYPICVGRAHNATQGRYLIKLPVPMRASATVTFSDFTKVRELCNHQQSTPTSFTAGTMDAGGYLSLYTTTSGLVTDELCGLMLQNEYMDVSADL